MEIGRREFLAASAATAGQLASGNYGFAEPPKDDRSATENPFLKENFAPIREEITAEHLL